MRTRPDELPEEHLTAVGRIAVNFARLEFFLRIGITFLIGGDQRIGQIVGAELSLGQLLSVLSSLVRLRSGGDPKRVAQFDELRKRALDVERRRGLVMHSLWVLESDTTDAMRFKFTAKMKKGLQFHAEKFSPEDLHDLADEINRVAQGLLNFAVDLNESSKEGKGPAGEGRA